MANKKPRILFIEDDPDQIYIYDNFFKRMAPEMVFVSATDKAESISSFRKKLPQMILADVLLNGENGLDVVEALRKEPQGQDIPVVIFTNYDKVEEKNRAAALGVLAYVPKTKVVPKEMLEKIRKFFQKGVWE